MKSIEEAKINESRVKNLEAFINDILRKKQYDGFYYISAIENDTTDTWKVQMRRAYKCEVTVNVQVLGAFIDNTVHESTTVTILHNDHAANKGDIWKMEED